MWLPDGEQLTVVQEAFLAPSGGPADLQASVKRLAGATFYCHLRDPCYNPGGLSVFTARTLKAWGVPDLPPVLRMGFLLP